MSEELIDKKAVLKILRDPNKGWSKVMQEITDMPNKADEWVSVKEGDFVVFEYYTETKCVIDRGIVIWIADGECCVETGVNKKKRHQMEVSALKKKLIDVPTPPNPQQP